MTLDGISDRRSLRRAGASGAVPARSDTRLDVNVGHLAVAQLIVYVQLGGRVAVDQVLLAVHLAQIAHRADRAAAALQGLAEGRAELAIEVGVDERIERAVEVTDPEHHRHYHVAALARVAQRRDDVPAFRWKTKKKNKEQTHYFDFLESFRPRPNR